MISRSDVGAWVVKGDPKTWDYFRFLAEAEEPSPGQLARCAWTLGKTYRNKLIAKGDLIALWITGQERPGIYEFGAVTGDEPYERDGFDDRYAVDHERATRRTWAIDYEAIRLSENYVPRDELKADPVLQHCEQFHVQQGSNPSYLSGDEAHALARLVAERVARRDFEASGWAEA